MEIFTLAPICLAFTITPAFWLEGQWQRQEK